MTSSNRNSRKALQALSLIAVAALLTGSAAHAAAQPSKFVMTAYTDGIGGSHIVSGDYVSALDQLHKHEAAAQDSSSTANNQCVAYAMVGKFENAMSACNAAIEAARRDIVFSASVPLWQNSMYEDSLAVAYSNRAVVDWLARDAASAARDLARASDAAPQADFVSQNMTALHSAHENAIAQLTVTTHATVAR